jgi:rhodanese-related sulfurtransferase
MANDIVRGTMVGVSEKFKTIQVAAGSVVWVMKYGDDIKLTGIAGDPNTVISYVLKPRPGEISIEEFKMIAENGAPDKVILDVRDVDEAMNGMLKGAINIPAGRIKERLADLPKDKEIITHCTTGIRAEMAYDDLRENGIKTRFLNAVIQVDKDGNYEITKK